MNETLGKDAEFWNGIARKYSAQKVADPDAYAHTLARTRSYLHAEDTVIELGCGTGSTALTLSDAVAHYVATDVSPEMITIAKEKSGRVENVTFKVSDAHVASEPAGQMDAVLAFSLLHLVPDLDATLNRVAELLKPRGVLISKTVCLSGEWYLRPVIGLLQMLGKAPAVSFLSNDTLDAKIAAAGFELIEVDEHNKHTRGHFVVARKL